MDAHGPDHDCGPHDLHNGPVLQEELVDDDREFRHPPFRGARQEPGRRQSRKRARSVMVRAGVLSHLLGGSLPRGLLLWLKLLGRSRARRRRPSPAAPALLQIEGTRRWADPWPAGADHLQPQLHPAGLLIDPRQFGHRLRDAVDSVRRARGAGAVAACLPRAFRGGGVRHLADPAFERPTAERIATAELHTFRRELEQELAELIDYHRQRLREAVTRLLDWE